MNNPYILLNKCSTYIPVSCVTVYDIIFNNHRNIESGITTKSNIEPINVFVFGAPMFLFTKWVQGQSYKIPENLRQEMPPEFLGICKF